MVDNSLLVSSLFPTSSSSSSDSLAIFRNDSTIESVTTDLLNTKYNIEQPASSVSISDDFRQFVADNVNESKAAQLLADIDAIDNFNNSPASAISDPVGQLIGADSTTSQTSIVDLLA